MKLVLDYKQDVKIYRREHDLLVSPMIRADNIARHRLFMNYQINIQLLLAAYYLGHSGDSLSFIAGSLNLPQAQHIRQTTTEIRMK